MGNLSVTIFHPPSQRTQRVSGDAFDREYSEAGWRLVGEPDQPPTPVPSVAAAMLAAKALFEALEPEQQNEVREIVAAEHPDEVAASEAAGSDATGTEEAREELLAKAEALGIKVRANAKAETIAARIAEHLAELGEDPDDSDDGSDDEDLDDLEDPDA